jgi:hypothetical protein
MSIRFGLKTRCDSGKGQVVADFIIDHMVVVDGGVGLVEVRPWSFFFDGSVCSKGHGVGCFILSLNGGSYELSIRLEFT